MDSSGAAQPFNNPLTLYAQYMTQDTAWMNSGRNFDFGPATMPITQ